MHRSFIRAVLAYLAFSFLYAAPPAQAAPPSVDGATIEPDRTRWPHEVGDLPADPAVRYGRLSNGMRYAIMHNQQPAGVTSIRLRIAAGSLYESEETLGLAHFIEHMNFNGSKNVPEGDLVKILQRSGLAFGADTNAYTSFGETVYKLDLPKSDEATLGTALTLLRETADRLTFEPAAIDRERGVILSEERSRDSPEYRASRSQFGFLLRGQPLPNRFPIGTRETIQRVDRQDFREFYQALYRPERALLVVVGDIDPAAIETRLSALFGDWSAQVPTAPEARLGAVAPRKAEAAVYTEPGLPANVELAWAAVPDLDPDTRAERREEVVRALGYALVRRRLQNIARAPDAPFVSATIGRSVLERSMTIVSLDVSVQPDRWNEGMAAAEQAVRQALQHGFSQSELNREVAEYRVAWEASVSGAGTRNTRGLADRIVGAYSADAAFTHPSFGKALFEDVVSDLRPLDVVGQLRRDFRADGPLIFVTDSRPIEGGSEAVLAAYRDSARTRVKKIEEQKEIAFDFAFGAPGAVASRTRAEEFDVDLIRFENGVRLTLKKTPYQTDRVYVNVRFPGGLAQWPKDKPGLAILAPFVMNEGGAGSLSREDLDRALADKVVGFSFDVGENDLSWSGATRPADLEVQMQVLAALTSEPGFRTEGLQRMQSAADNFLRQYNSTPGRVFGRDASAILRSGDGRWAFPTLEQVRSLTIADFRSALAPTLARAPIEISVVGDIDRDAAVAAVSKTFGAFAPRTDVLPVPEPIRFPRAGSTTLSHDGRPDQALSAIYWPSVDFSDTRKARAARIARLLLENRLVEEYREVQGATYSPGTSEDFSDVFQGYGYVGARVEAPAEAADGFFRTVATITASLKAGSFDADELARARGPEAERLRTGERTNGYWTSVLQDAQTNPRRLHVMRSRISEFESISKDEIVAAARATFDDTRAVKIRVLPKAK